MSRKHEERKQPANGPLHPCNGRWRRIRNGLGKYRIIIARELASVRLTTASSKLHGTAYPPTYGLKRPNLATAMYKSLRKPSPIVCSRLNPPWPTLLEMKRPCS